METSESATQSEEARFERRWSKKSSSTIATPEIQPGSESESGDDLEKERARANDLYQRLQRSMADLSNLRKRVEAEREEMSKFASMMLVAELLPVLDNFQRALDAIPNELQHFTWLQGILLIDRHLRAILERQGLEPIEALGKPFDPSLHEAIVEEESSEAEPGTVIGDLQMGYTMHGHLLRPTLAKVARVPESPSSTVQDTEDNLSDDGVTTAVSDGTGTEHHAAGE